MDDLSRGIRINETAPAGPLERTPRTFRLREAVSDRIDNGRIVPKATMAALNFNVFGKRGRSLDANTPCTDAVSAAEDRGGWNRRRIGERPAECLIRIFGPLPAHH